MLNEMYIGSTPPEEECEQLGDNYNPQRARKECRAYIHQLRRVLGPEPEGASLVIKSNPHDFGTYLTVVCMYDDTEAATLYAYKCESDGPMTWDREAKRELGLI
jgi:hypothetical protein